MVGVSAGLIPFLEHDDANRALMGSNMQRQAVPLLVTEPPLVSHRPGKGRGQEQRHGRPGREGRHRHLRRCRAHQGRRARVRPAQVRRPQRAHLPEPEADRQVGQKVKKGQIIADGAATHQGELALGRNVLVAFMSWDGYNFEDAIIISEKLVKKTPTPRSTSRSSRSKSARPSWARRSSPATFPTSRPRPWATSTRTASSASAPSSGPGDILVGKVSPKSQERADARRKAAARDLRPGRRGREERQPGSALRRRRHRHRHAALQPPRQHDRGGDARRSTRSKRRSRTATTS